jgi:hypothetical protein
MDSGGHVWLMAALNNGDWCYFEVGAGGGTVHAFKMPSYNGYSEPLNPPVVTSDGALWMEMGRNPDYLLRVMPG